ncbi:MAG: polysaccharide biosynthesis C-terminal domain-containing protein [Candidatus Omnitrophota bacterium]
MTGLSEKRDTGVGLNFARFVAGTAGVSFSGHIFSFFVSVLVARALGPTAKGIVTIVLLYPMLLFTIGHLSINRAIISHAGLSRYSVRDFCGTLGFFALLMSVVLFAVFWSGYSLFPSFFIRSVSPSVIFLGFLILPMFFINQLYSGILQTQQEINKLNAIAFSQAFFTFLAMAVMLALGGLTVTRVVWAYVIANAVSAGLALVFALRLYPGGWFLRMTLLKGLVIDGLKLHSGVIAIIVFLKIDQLMLSQYRGATSVGFYTISVSYSELLLLVPMAIQNVFYAKISRMLAEKIDLVPKTLLVYRHNFYLLLFLSIVLALGAYPFIILFYGRAFLPSVMPFLVLLPGAFFLYWNNILTNYLVGTQKFWVISVISVGAAILNILLNMFFIPLWDASGAAFASSITYFLVGLAYIKVFMHYGRLSPKAFWSNLRFTRDDLALYKEVFRSIFPLAR